MEKKRIKLHLKQPNPLFELWLTELYTNAVAESNPAQMMYKKALASLKKYPLTLKSGSECGIIRGFGKKLCKILDQKLIEHRSAEQSSSILIETNTEIKSPERSPLMIVKCHQVPLLECDILYKSEEYVILMVIFEYRNSEGSITKTEIEKNIQKYCNETCLNQNMNLNASMWTCINALIKRDLLQWDLIDDKFCLTLNGEDLIKRFPGNRLEPMQIPIVTNKNVIEDMIVDENEVININTNNVNKCVKDVLNTHSRKGHIFDECETSVVFLPNSFEVILLVDKQENSGYI